MGSKIKIMSACLVLALVLLFLLTYRTVLAQGGPVRTAYCGALLLAVVSGCYVLSWAVSAVSGPIRSLTESIRHVRDGDLDYIMDYDSGDEIGAACSEFDRLRIQLKEEEQRRQQFESENKELISNISHDLKTPITSIKGYVEGIMDGVASSPEMLNRYVRTIYTKANDMDRLIDELTYYTKIDTNRIPYRFDKVSPVEFFDDCLEDVGADLDYKGISYSYTNDVSPSVMVIADAEQLKRVVVNIISNSIKYMDKEQKHLAIRVKDEGDFVQVEIEDNGKGIDVRELPNIFDRFYRTDASRNSRTGGSGIGLSIVRKIIEDHGGRIWARSTLGEGTTMIFILRKYQEAEYEQDTDRRG